MNIVFYSYKKSQHDHINDHELKRLDHSIKSLREFNNEISVYLFCDHPAIIPPYFTLNYNINVLPFVEGFNHEMLNAWSIHRWYNLRYFQDGEGTFVDANILYVDSDTIFYGDIQYLFDTYNTNDVYGREEFGFRHDPTTGGGKLIRQQLDAVDDGIRQLGGEDHIYKYCCGVMLLNDGIHVSIIQRLEELTDLMGKFDNNEIQIPIPNKRIVDQYAIWVILSRIGVICSLFGLQDVTQGWVEEKHREHFNPIVLHYTTKKEQQFARSNPKYSNLVRDDDKLSEDIDPYMNASLQSVDHLSSDMVELLSKDSATIVEDTGEEWVYEG